MNTVVDDRPIQSPNSKAVSSQPSLKTYKPSLEVIPAHAGVRDDGVTELNVLVRIEPPLLKAPPDRPPLNLVLIIGCSDSLLGSTNLWLALGAVSYLIRQLQPGDRVSVILIKDGVEVLVESTLAQDLISLLEKVRSVRWLSTLNNGAARGDASLGNASRGNASLGVDGLDDALLLQGWRRGCDEAMAYQGSHNLTRVMVFTDRLASEGCLDAAERETLTTQMREVSESGLGTTVIGVGDDCDEDQLGAIALKGNGHFHVVRDDDDFEHVFGQEIQSLVPTVGTHLRLHLEEHNGVHFMERLNASASTWGTDGSIELPNLLAHRPIEVLMRFHVPPQAAEADLCSFRLLWDPVLEYPLQGSPSSWRGRQEQRVTLRLPAMSTADWDALPVQQEVWQHVLNVEAAAEALE